MKNKFVQFAMAAIVSIAATKCAIGAPLSFTSAAAFTAALGGASVTVESFESAPGGTPTSLIFPNVTVTCTGSVWCPSFFGVSTLMPTDGTKGVFFATPDTITFSFGSPVNAFGIDVGDLGTVGATTLSASLSNGGSVTFFTNFSGPTFNQLFAGVIDTTPFTSVTFHGTAPDDGIYFDRMRIANLAVGVPEPASYTMILIGAGLLAWMRHRGNSR